MGITSHPTQPLASNSRLEGRGTWLQLKNLPHYLSQGRTLLCMKNFVTHQQFAHYLFAVFCQPLCIFALCFALIMSDVPNVVWEALSSMQVVGCKLGLSKLCCH